MVRFDGRPLYPQRRCDTISYGLSPSEQALYEATTRYISEIYNRARVLNRSAARTGDERFPAPAGELDARIDAVIRAPPRSARRGDRPRAGRPGGRARARPESSRGDPPTSSRPVRRTRTPTRRVRAKATKRSRTACWAASSRRPWRSCGKSVARSRRSSPGRGALPTRARTRSSRSSAGCCAAPASPARSSSSSPSLATPPSSWSGASRGWASPDRWRRSTAASTTASARRRSICSGGRSPTAAPTTWSPPTRRARASTCSSAG